jgi:hypothetical protein
VRLWAIVGCARWLGAERVQLWRGRQLDGSESYLQLVRAGRHEGQVVSLFSLICCRGSAQTRRREGLTRSDPLALALPVPPLSSLPTRSLCACRSCLLFAGPVAPSRSLALPRSLTLPRSLAPSLPRSLAPSLPRLAATTRDLRTSRSVAAALRLCVLQAASIMHFVQDVAFDETFVLYIDADMVRRGAEPVPRSCTVCLVCRSDCLSVCPYERPSDF